MKKKHINELLMALYLSIPMITKLISSIYQFDNNIILLVGLILFFSVFYNKKENSLHKNFILINLLILLLFLISFLKLIDVNYTIYYLYNYFLYGAVAMYLLHFEYDYKFVFKYISLIFMLFTIILVTKYIPLISMSSNLDFTMDLSYSVLVGYIATLIYLKYVNFKPMKIFSIICLIINSYYLLVLNNNRGSIIVLILFFMIHFLEKIKKKRNKIFISLFLMIFVIIGVNILFDNLYKINTNINWLNRLIFQAKQNNISSSRDLLFDDAMNLIKDKPFFGYGIGYFESKHNGLYTHNMFLQLICESGLFALLTVGIYSIVCCYKNIFDSNDSERLVDRDFKLYLLLQSIPRLMISSVYWLNSYFWMYLYINLIGGKNEKKQITQANNKISDI